MKALITGISGQDGSYLAEHLLAKNYEVFGIVRRNSSPGKTRIDHIEGPLTLFVGDVLDEGAVDYAVAESQPDEVYNLAAQSHVGLSFAVPKMTVMVAAIGALNVFNACRRLAPSARIYQASSSECFGNSVDADGFQRESTPMRPVSPYASAKTLAHHMVQYYRRDLFVCSGIAFNHESPRRGPHFVTMKVVQGAVKIHRGEQSTLALGNLDTYRDWGHSKDYVRAMHMMLQGDKAEDFVIATGETRSVRSLCEHVFKRLDMDYRDYVTQDPQFIRPTDVTRLRGDATKLREAMGWSPDITFESMLDDMIDHALADR